MLKVIKKIFKPKIILHAKSINHDCRFAVIQTDSHISKSNIDQIKDVFKDSDLFIGVKSVILPKGAHINQLSDEDLSSLGLVRINQNQKFDFLKK